VRDNNNDRLQSQRFELKYIIGERVALSVRDYVRSYLELDEYGVSLPDYSYPVHSLYLDSPDLKLYRATINGDKNRFKLRLRFYENRPDTPVYCEIKSRMNNTIAKQRGGIRREAVGNLMAGHLPEPSHLIFKSSKQLVALQRFCQAINELQAQPRTHVAYLREAWISPQDNSVRVTLDRRIRTELDPSVRLDTRMVNPIHVFGDHVVLELKFTGRFPDWFKELVRVFGLMQCGAAKYADGVTILGAGAVSNAFALDDYYVAAEQRLQRVNGARAPKTTMEMEATANT
jgi:VTC domain